MKYAGWYGVYRQVSPICAPVSSGPVPTSGDVLGRLCKMRDARLGSAPGSRWMWILAARGPQRGGGRALRGRLMKDSALISSPQGASGRREHVGQPRPAAFLRRDEDSGAEAECEAAAAGRRRLQPLAVVRLHRAEGNCSNTARIDRKTAHLDTITPPHPHPPSVHAA